MYLIAIVIGIALHAAFWWLRLRYAAASALVGVICAAAVTAGGLLLAEPSPTEMTVVGGLVVVTVLVATVLRPLCEKEAAS